jgi:hypothetical protein
MVLMMLLLGACATEGRSTGASAGTPSPSPAPSKSAVPSAPPSAGVGPQPDRSDTPACGEVRAGIDDFNVGDFQGTVGHFRTAVPLARKQAASDGTTAARQLLEAVRYYAELAPDDYLSSAASSPQFARYKAITLGQCVASATVPPPGESTESPGVTA